MDIKQSATLHILFSIALGSAVATLRWLDGTRLRARRRIKADDRIDVPSWYSCQGGAPAGGACGRTTLTRDGGRPSSRLRRKGPRPRTGVTTRRQESPRRPPAGFRIRR